MGTWGSGLLENDSAEDFLNEMAALDQNGRFDKIRKIVNAVADNPAVVMRQFVPEEVVAAVAVVAAAFPGTSEYEWTSAINSALDEGIPAQNARDLAAAALRALRSIVDDENGWWVTSWVSDSDRADAQRQIQEIKSTLRKHGPEGKGGTA
jgi:hypothetical protein